MRASAVPRMVLCALAMLCGRGSHAQIVAQDTILVLEFVAGLPQGLKLLGGARRVEGKYGGAIEFRSATDIAELPFNRKLDGLTEMSIGGWFFIRRQGEQYFFSRGTPQTGDDATRRFPPEKTWVNFVLGTDQRGFLIGTINGNGTMPFPYVTVNEIAIDAWHQIVVVKDRHGLHHFYHNGAHVHSSGYADRANVDGPVGNALRGVPEAPSGVAISTRPTERDRGRSLQNDVCAPREHESKNRYIDKEPGEPIRLQMPAGGLAGEAWIFGRALTNKEIAADFEEKRRRYHPALTGKPVELREMNAHPAAGLWKSPITAENWPSERERIKKAVIKLLGPFPSEKAPLDARIESDNEDRGKYVRRKVSFQVQPGDRMPCWLLVPKKLEGRAPAVICFYGTTSGGGKDVTAGVSGRAPGTPPVRNLAFAIDIAEAGLVALAPDYLRDGERIKPGRRPYDTTDFYKEFPDWSVHGKDVWDTIRAIDFLETLNFVDANRIGMIGHSYGGHSTIFTTALEPRIKVAVANGPVSDFLHHGLHWAVPKGGGASQSLPALRPYVLDHTLPLPVTFYEFTSLIAPRPLLVGQAAGEHRPMEEENHAAVRKVYAALGQPQRVRYHWYAGDHDFPPPARKAAVEWFRKWFGK